MLTEKDTFFLYAVLMSSFSSKNLAPTIAFCLWMISLPASYELSTLYVGWLAYMIAVVYANVRH